MIDAYQTNVAKKVSIFSIVTYILLLFFYLFQPPFFSKFYYIGFEALLFFFFFSLYSKSLLRIIFTFKNEIFIILLIVIYSIFRDFLSSEIVYSDRFLAWSFQSFFLGAVIILFFNKKNVPLIDFLFAVFLRQIRQNGKACCKRPLNPIILILA